MFTKFNQFELSTDKQQAVLGGDSPRFLGNIGGATLGSIGSATINQGAAANSTDAAERQAYQQLAQQQTNDKKSEVNDLLTNRNQFIQSMPGYRDYNYM